MKKSLLIIFACSVFLLNTHAQFISNAPKNNENLNLITYQKWTTANGLIANKINDLQFDANGLLWIATNSGISTFDGTTFTNYTTANGLASNTVTRLYKDHLNRIWAEGANTFSVYNGSWQPHPINSQLVGLGDNMNGSVFQDNSNNFYFISHNPGSIYKFDDTHYELYIPRANYSTYSAKFDINNNLWILAYDTISKYNGITRVSRQYLNSFSCGGYNKIVSDRNNHLWVLHCNGLYKSTDYSTFFQLGDTWNYYHDAGFDSQNNAVLGRYGKVGGIKTYNGSVFREIKAPEGFINGAVYAIEISSIDKIWAGSDDGLYLINEVITSDISPSVKQAIITPNPVKHTFSLNNCKDAVDFTITDVSGKELFKFSKVNSGQLIDVSSLNNGVYFIKVFQSNGNSIIEKLIKN